MNYIEKRIFRRLETQVPVEVELGQQPLKTKTVNISCGGMFLKLKEENLPPNIEDLDLVIHLPNQNKPVKLSAELNRRSNQGVAVEFQGLYNDNILAIEKFIKSHLN
ncbi:MAG: PilZ domain-containing protein [Deltaproteobacteria bacterium]|nr:PilZ domain-containing protein [Deltaproteobacteria bacterium]